MFVYLITKIIFYIVILKVAIYFYRIAKSKKSIPTVTIIYTLYTQVKNLMLYLWFKIKWLLGYFNP